MEKKFTYITKKIKAYESHQIEVSKTFEFDLFKESSWFLIQNQWDENLSIPENVNEIISEKSFEIVQGKTSKKLLFVGDTFKSDSENSNEDLLMKMIMAMKLIDVEIKRLKYSLEFEDITDLEENLKNPIQEFSTFLNQIAEFEPTYVISLGATMTNLLLGRREKMSAIHGKVFEIYPKNKKVLLMPLFHPDFLQINPNMKRTAWTDLQKMIELIGQI